MKISENICWKREVCAVNYVQSDSPVKSRLTSSFTCQPISLIIYHSFTRSLQAQNLLF